MLTIVNLTGLHKHSGTQKMDISRYWKTIVDTLQDGLMVIDPQGTILAVNPAAERLTGYEAAE